MKKFVAFLKRCTRKIRTGEYRGSNRVSLKIRLLLERVSLRQWIGVQLAGASFLAGLVVPQAPNIYSSLEIVFQTPQEIISVGPSESTYQWPMRAFGISQRFSLVHPGLDLTDPTGTPIYPISAGRVVWTKILPFGYGQHVLVDNGDGVQSLYAHLSQTDVTDGQTLTKHTKLGEVGATGWATGDHLHLEIYQAGTPINPLEILPEIKE